MINGHNGIQQRSHKQTEHREVISNVNVYLTASRKTDLDVNEAIMRTTVIHPLKCQLIISSSSRQHRHC